MLMCKNPQPPCFFFNCTVFSLTHLSYTSVSTYIFEFGVLIIYTTFIYSKPTRHSHLCFIYYLYIFNKKKDCNIQYKYNIFKLKRHRKCFIMKSPPGCCLSPLLLALPVLSAHSQSHLVPSIRVKDRVRILLLDPTSTQP